MAAEAALIAAAVAPFPPSPAGGDLSVVYETRGDTAHTLACQNNQRAIITLSWSLSATPYEREHVAHMATLSCVGAGCAAEVWIDQDDNVRNLAQLEGVLPHDQRELEFYELAIKLSGAVQAARWTETAYGHGFIHSFNGPHSLFSDTMRSLRILGLAHQLGHVLMGEGDKAISLLGRLVEHAVSNAKYNVY